MDITKESITIYFKRYILGIAVFFALLIYVYLEGILGKLTVNSAYSSEHENILFFLKLIKEIVYFFAIVVSVHFFYHWFVRKQEEEAISKLFEDQLIKQSRYIKDEVIPNMVTHGLKGIHKIGIKRLISELKQGDSFYWLDTYCPTGYDRFAKSLKDAVIRGANVRILTIKPDSQNAAYRAGEVITDPNRGESIADVKEDIERWQKRLGVMYRELINVPGVKGTFDVEWYEDLPGMPIYIHFRNEQPVLAYTGFYLNGTAANYVFLEWQQSSSRFIYDLVSYFDTKWEKNKNEQNLIISLTKNICLIKTPE